MTDYNQNSSQGYITLREFKQIIKDFNIELIKGQELSENDFHECCRQMFSQVCNKTGKNTNFNSSAKQKSGENIANSKANSSFGRTLNNTEFNNN